MTQRLDLTDIQGLILRAYARFGYHAARYVFLNIRRSAAGHAFLGGIAKSVTSAAEWGDGPGQIRKPECAVNIAFTFQGLKELELPTDSLVSFAPEFVAGMKVHKDILGDDGPSAPKHWDPIWQGNHSERELDVHILVTLNVLDPATLDRHHRWLLDLVASSAGAGLESAGGTGGTAGTAGLAVLGGNRGPGGALLDYQDVCELMEDGRPTAKEHFGYVDGISDPVFEGMPASYSQSVHGRGKQMKDGGWAPLATGEFLLGHIDEAREYPPAPQPLLLARNGSYLVYRKLHENVATFDAYLEQHGKKYPGGKELLAAKFVGRWRDNGAPLAKAPDAASKALFDAEFAKADAAGRDRMLSDFTFDDDISGSRCPFSAHVRRANPRASLQMVYEPGQPPGSLSYSPDAFNTPGALVNRRRVLRRGRPYGAVQDRGRDDGDHGIIMMIINADINRQFEFVQQQWINYGNDFRASNDKDIILGNHSCDERFPSQATLQVDPDSDEAPYFLTKIPRLVETRGGDYFFIPSITALKMIAKGVIDPT